MRHFWNAFGRTVFWILWPLLILYLRNTKRTRAVIVYGDSVLVIKKWLGDGKWSLPGGGLHGSETPLSGVMREVGEETGVRLKAEAFREQGIYQFKHQGFNFTCHLFSAVVSERYSLSRQPYEISAIDWIKIGTLSEKNADPDTLYALQALPS
jgi:8-oxo-dGTP pyrophosphatase MutT (NUDIX family)